MAASRSVSLTRQLAMFRSARGSVGEQREHGQGHGGIGDRVAIEVDCRQGPTTAPDLEPARARVDPGPHGSDGLDEADVALDRCAADAVDAQGGVDRRDGAGGDEVGRGRSVALDDEGSGRARRLAAAQAKTLPTFTLDGDTEPIQHRERDLDIGLRDELAVDFDDGIGGVASQGQGEQQGTEELAGDVAAHLDRRARASALPGDKMRSGGKPSRSR